MNYPDNLCRKSRIFFTIVTVCKNNLLGLRETFRSIEEQNFQAVEWLVIDGNSTDGTRRYLEELNAPFLSYWLSERDCGIYNAMNKARPFITGCYILYLNAGDTLEQAALTNVSQLMAQRKFDIYLFSYYLNFKGGAKLLRQPRELATYIWHGVPTSHQATFFSYEVIKEIPYDESFSICGDYLLMARTFVMSYKAVTCTIPLVSFEVGGLSFQRPFLLIYESWLIKREILHLNIFIRIASSAKSIVSLFGLRVVNKLRSPETMTRFKSVGRHWW